VQAAEIIIARKELLASSTSFLSIAFVKELQPVGKDILLYNFFYSESASPVFFGGLHQLQWSD